MPYQAAHPTRRSIMSPWLALLVAALAVVLYWNTIDNELLDPDRVLTSANPQLKSDAPLSRLWLAPLPAIEGATPYRPVHAMLLRMQWSSWGESPSSYHGFNLLLWVGVLLVMLGWISRLTPHQGMRLAAVLTVAVHPMAGHAVRLVEGQGLMLALIGVLGALWVLQLYRDGRIGHGLTAASLMLLGILAIGSHELGAILPLWLAGQWVLTPREKPISLTRVGREVARSAMSAREFQPIQLAVVFLPLALVGSIYMVLRTVALGSLAMNSIAGGENLPATQFGMIGSSFATGLGRLLWPVNPTVNWSLAHDATLAPPAWLGWLALAALAGLCVWLWRRRSVGGLGLAMTLTALLAISHIVPRPVFFSETPLLFALPGLGLGVGVLVARLTPAWLALPAGLPARALVLGLLAVWSLLAVHGWMRGQAWRDDVSLWQAEARLQPENPYPRLMLLDQLIRRQRLSSAREVEAELNDLLTRPADVDRAIELRAGLYAAAGDDAALDQLLADQIASEQPHRRGHMQRLALVASLQGLDRRIAPLLERELEHHPDSYGALIDLADLERNRGRWQRASELYQRAVTVAPDSARRAQALEGYGLQLAERGLMREGAHQLQTALELDPTRYLSYLHLARIHRDLGNHETARTIINTCMMRLKLVSYVDLARIYVSVLEAQDKNDEAATWVEYTANSYPTDFDLGLFAARYLIELQRYEPARRLLNGLAPRVQQPTHAIEVWNAMALVEFFGERDYAAAERLVRRVLQASPEHVEAGRLLERLKATRERIDQQQRAAQESAVK